MPALTTQMSSQQLRAAFSGLCDPEDQHKNGGKHHPGHARCVRARKRREAGERQEIYRLKTALGQVAEVRVSIDPGKVDGISIAKQRYRKRKSASKPRG